jgi:hypothetical protein
MTPKPGWKNESERHSLAKYGIRTKTPKSISKLTDKYVGGNQWTFKIDEHGKIFLTNGNMTTAGWYWLGNETDLLLFLSRLASSKERNNFIIQMEKEGITFEQLKPLILKSLKTGDDQLWAISGDNGRWRFGNYEPDTYNLFDDIPDADREKVENAFWNKYRSVSYEDYMKEHKSDLERGVKELIASSTNYADFFKHIDKLEKQSLYDYDEMETDNVYRTLQKVRGN